MKPTELKGRNLALRNAGARRSVGATFRLDIFLFDQAGTERAPTISPAVQASLVPLHTSLCSWWE